MQVGSGCFSARITDPLCQWNAALWRFGSSDGALQVTRADEADCYLSIQALRALVYGAHDPDDFAIRGWGNPSPAVQAVMRAMFQRYAVSARILLDCLTLQLRMAQHMETTSNRLPE
jgi:hypothetical protein